MAFAQYCGKRRRHKRLWIFLMVIVMTSLYTNEYSNYDNADYHTHSFLPRNYAEMAEALDSLTSIKQCMQSATQASLTPDLQLADRVEHFRRRAQNLLSFMYYDVGSQLYSLSADRLNASFRSKLFSYVKYDYSDYLIDLSEELEAFKQAVTAMQLSMPLKTRQAVQYCLSHNANLADNTGFYNYMTSFVQLSELLDSTTETVRPEQANDILTRFTQQHILIGSVVSEWSDFSSLLVQRHIRLTRLSETLAKHITQVQHPQTCDSQRKLICQLYKSAGFASEVRRALYCFSLALASGRVLQIDSAGMLNGTTSWDDLFLPVTSCTDITKNAAILSKSTERKSTVRVIFYDKKNPVYEPDYRPRTIPLEIFNEATALLGDPFEWFTAQLAGFLLRMPQKVKQKVMAAVDALQLKQPHTIGMHIRRTDKSDEVSAHSIKEYFDVAELYYRRLEQENVDKSTKYDGKKPSKKHGKIQRRIFLATDDPNVLKEARKLYPQYKIIADDDRSKLGGVYKRYSSDGLLGAWIDIYALTLTDFVVCTMSSSFCGLVYTIKQSAEEDASTSVFSLDSDWWSTKNFNQKDRKFKVVHVERPDSERALMGMVPNDIITVRNTLKFGFANGTNTRTKVSKLLRLSKVQEMFDAVAFNISM